MKIAIIGSSPQNFFNPIAKELKARGFQIDLFALGEKEISAQQQDLYNDKKIGLIQHCKFSVSRLLGSLGSLLSMDFWRVVSQSSSLKEAVKMIIFFNVFSSIKNYDIVNVQQMQLPHQILKFLKPQQKLFISFWGSDIFRANPRLIAEQKEWVQRADHVSLHHREMEDIFKERFSFYNNGVTKCLFPLDQTLFNLIVEVSETRRDKINVAIGYNMNPGFQHLEILQSLVQLPEAIRQTINVQLFAAYGINEEYVQKILSFLDQHGIEFQLFNKRVSLEELAIRRKETDILIQMPVSDAFSASVAEVLYSGNLVIAGDWLPYSLYQENGVYFKTLPSVAELPNLLESILKNIETEKESCNQNPDNVLKTLNYEGNLVKWVSIFEELYGTN